MAQPIHPKLLTEAARRILQPLGLHQSGRSRLWYSDQDWWLIVVEFQPSSWSKGSYLNVGAMWLWSEKDYFSFDDGCRVEGFTRFEDETQFSLVAENLARKAAGEVGRYLAQYSSIHNVARYLSAKSPKGLWDGFHAGVACGLAGESTLAKEFLNEVGNTNDQPEWAQAAASLAQEYIAALDDLSEFRFRINEVIRRTRGLLRLD